MNLFSRQEKKTLAFSHRNKYSTLFFIFGAFELFFELIVEFCNEKTVCVCCCYVDAIIICLYLTWLLCQLLLSSLCSF